MFQIPDPQDGGAGHVVAEDLGPRPARVVDDGHPSGDGGYKGPLRGGQGDYEIAVGVFSRYPDGTCEPQGDLCRTYHVLDIVLGILRLEAIFGYPLEGSSGVLLDSLAPLVDVRMSVAPVLEPGTVCHGLTDTIRNIIILIQRRCGVRMSPWRGYARPTVGDSESCPGLRVCGPVVLQDPDRYGCRCIVFSLSMESGIPLTDHRRIRTVGR